MNPQPGTNLDAQRHEELQAVSDAIGRLQRISLAIRRAGSKTTLSRAAAFVIHDTIGENVEFDVDFKAYVETVLDHRIRQARQSLREQLASVISLRRRRFLYSREHQRKLQHRTEEWKSTSTPEKRNITAPVPGAPPEGSSTPARNPNHESQRSETNASAFDRKHFVFEPTSTVASSKMSFSPVALANPDIPAAPKVDPGSYEHECPYCCWLLPAKVFNSDRRWRQHIEQDLEPYMCLSEDCFRPPKLFASMNNWAAHINEQHSCEWACPLHQEGSRAWLSSPLRVDKGKQSVRDNPREQAPVTDELPEPSSFTFGTKQGMEDHLKNYHRELSASQTRIIIRRSARPGVSRIFQSCPFCDWLPEGGSKSENRIAEYVSGMQEHIANHLLTLSLMSLPWRDDAEAEDEFDRTESHASPCSWQVDQGTKSVGSAASAKTFLTATRSDEESQAWDSESTQSNTSTTMAPWTPPKEARAPPIYGYPGANKPYQRDLPLPNAIRPDDSAFVWDRRGDVSTARVLFDSGAEPNFASREKVEALYFSPLPLNENDMELCETLGGHEGLATHYVSMDIEIKSLNLKRHPVSFFVVDSNRIDIILGQNYMESMGIWEKKVEKKGSMTAYATFSKNPTPGKIPLPDPTVGNSLTLCLAEQIKTMLEEKALLAKKAQMVEATVRGEGTAVTSVRKPTSRANSTSSTGSACLALGFRCFHNALSPELFCVNQETREKYRPCMGPGWSSMRFVRCLTTAIIFVYRSAN